MARVTDDERRRVAAALREYRKETTNRGFASLFDILDACGLTYYDGVVLYDRLADLIDPSEPKVKCVAEVKIDGERLEQLVHDAAVELAGIDRDALLALAEEMIRHTTVCREYSRDVEAMLIDAWVSRIREACGVES